MAIPDYQTLMLPVLRLTAEGYQRVPDMLPVIARDFGLTDEEMARDLPKGRAKVVANTTHWARTYLGKAGLVRPIRRGVFEVTEEGQKLLAEKPTRIDSTTLKRFPDFIAWLARTRERGVEEKTDEPDSIAFATSQIPTQTPQQRIEQASAELDAALADELLERLLNASPKFFEDAVVKLLLAMGYGSGDSGSGLVTGASGDGGIDGIISEDALGLDRVYVQAKRYAPENAVQRPAIQQFVGSLNGEGATKGVFVTTSSFSRGAQDFVGKVTQRIVLIDGQRLARLMIAHGVGVQTIETISLRAVDENFFPEE